MAGEQSRVRGRASRLWWLAFLVVLAWQVLGVFPAAPVEGDGEAIAAGSEEVAFAGLDAATECYRYAGQVGTYAILAAGRTVLGAPCLPTFAVISAVAAVAVVTLGASLLRTLLGIPFALAGLALLLFQETATAGFYPNSTVLAAAAFLLACVVAVSEWPARWLVAGLAVAAAGLLRADVILVAPVLPVLFHRNDARATARTTLACAATAILVYSASATMLAAGPTAAVREAVSHMGGDAAASLQVPGWLGLETVRALVAFLSPAWLLAFVLGVALLIRRRRWRLVLIVALGTVPLAIAYSRNLSSPKYLYYAIPFVAVAALAAATERTRPWRAAWTGAVVLLLAHQLIGIRVTVRSKPWVAPPRDAIVFARRSFTGGPFGRLELALGAGTIVPTADGPRLSSGQAFAPLVWHRSKVSTRRCQRRLEQLLDGPESTPGELFSGSWLAVQVVDNALWSEGFVPVDETQLPLPYGWRKHWRRGRDTIVHTSCEITSYEWDQRAFALRYASQPRVLYVVGGGRERSAMLSHTSSPPVCDDDGPTCIALLDLDLRKVAGWAGSD